jgi:hypothetical protein
MTADSRETRPELGEELPPLVVDWRRRKVGEYLFVEIAVGLIGLGALVFSHDLVLRICGGWFVLLGGGYAVLGIRRLLWGWMITITSEGIESPEFGLVHWDDVSAIGNRYRGRFAGRMLEIAVADPSAYRRKVGSRLLRAVIRSNERSGGPLIGLPERFLPMSAAELRAAIEKRARRSFPG